MKRMQPPRRVPVSSILPMLLAIVLAAPAWAEAPAAIDARMPLFQGVFHTHITRTDPRPLSIHVVEIDLHDPAVRFLVSPGNGDAPGESTRTTTSRFVADTGAQLAINASFFHKTDDSTPNVNNRGLAVSNGHVYSPFEDDGRPWPVFNLARDNAAQVFTQEQARAVMDRDTSPLYNAVSGNEHLIAEGRNVAGDQPYGQPGELHPRTAIGVTDDHRLMLMVVDGRQPGFSEGMTTREVAAFLLARGVVEAVNLDGGGSSTMVLADPQPRLVNRPSDGRERAVAACLAVFAAPLEKE